MTCLVSFSMPCEMGSNYIPADILSADDDLALADRIRSEDQGIAEAAFEALYRKYYAKMVSFGASYLRDNEAARELTGDVFLAIWERRREWHVQTSVATYLYQSLRHRAQNHIRNRSTESRNLGHALQIEAVPGLGRISPRADVVVEEQERVRQLWAAVDQLSDVRRAVVRLRWNDQLSFDEIASILGTSSAAVQMQLSRALKQLRALLFR
jgi:RNA polymerase sigma factor (sigma-70 family)